LPEPFQLGDDVFAGREQALRSAGGYSSDVPAWLANLGLEDSKVGRTGL
jgi:hypothetical protein